MYAHLGPQERARPSMEATRKSCRSLPYDNQPKNTFVMDKWQFDHTCMLLPMGGPTTTGVALVSLRFLASAVLLYSVFYLAMARGTWYREHFFANDELDYDISSGANMSTSHNQRALFLLLLPAVAAALGGIYQAVWTYREGKATQDGLPASSSSKAQSFLKAYNSIIHFQFRPLGKLSP